MSATHAERRPAAVSRSAYDAGGGFLGGVAGTLAAGLAVLTVVLVGATAFASFVGVGGPNTIMVLGHLIAAILAVSAAALADRAHGVLAWIAAVTAVTVVLSTLWAFWLA